jgi:hypothetical protein
VKYDDLDTRIEWGTADVRDRWAGVMADLGIAHRKSDPTSARGHAAARSMGDRLGDDEASEVGTYDTFGLWVALPIWDAWIAAQTDCRALPKADRPAFGRAALAAAQARIAEVA